ncbi:MAG: 3-ketoacyl-ACP reductase, partial [Chitinophagaceae bacterium]|nr:3-ketoacyl-ACP reductase [Chitinophagaceae bacterium]
MKKVALITGGSRGIGYGIATHLAAKGFDIAINGVRAEASVEEVLENLRNIKSDVIYCQGDISSKEDREKILQKVKDHFGKLHVLVNNAGVAPKERKDILETSEDSFNRVLSINLKGPYFLTQQAANWMIDQKKSDQEFAGCIINVTSISASVASVNRGEYCIS